MTRPYMIPRILLVVLAAGAAYAQALPPAASEPPATAVVVTTPPAVSTSRTVSVQTTGEPAARSVSLFDSSMIGTGAQPSAVLVVPGKALDAEALDRIVEDLTIMGRIIEKGLSPEFTSAAADVFVGVRMDHGGANMGPDVLLPSIGRAKPMYVGGYGALFFLQVNFPLLPPPETPEPPAKTEKVDPVWADAKRSLQEPESSRLDPYQQGQPAPHPYSAETVTALKAQLIGDLKHAANVAAIGPEEWLAIVVQGTVAAPQSQGQTASDPSSPAPAAAEKTVLTLRAKKADIDLFAADKLDRTQFEQRVQVITY